MALTYFLRESMEVPGACEVEDHCPNTDCNIAWVLVLLAYSQMVSYHPYCWPLYWLYLPQLNGSSPASKCKNCSKYLDSLTFLSSMNMWHITIFIYLHSYPKSSHSFGSECLFHLWPFLKNNVLMAQQCILIKTKSQSTKFWSGYTYVQPIS